MISKEKTRTSIYIDDTALVANGKTENNDNPVLMKLSKTKPRKPCIHSSLQTGKQREN